MLTRLNNALYKFYVTTWVFVLILFKRQVPKWLQKKVIDITQLDVVLPKIEKYVR